MTESDPDSLRTRRRLAGMTQRDVARLTGIAQPNIAAYESGRRTPTADTRQRVEAAIATPTLHKLRAFRDDIVQAAARRNLADVRRIRFGLPRRSGRNVRRRLAR